MAFAAAFVFVIKFMRWQRKKGGFDMTREQKIKLIRDNDWRDVTFKYKGKYGIITPDYKDVNLYLLSYGENTVIRDKDYEKVINAPVFDGKSLIDIADELTEVEAL